MKKFLKTGIAIASAALLSASVMAISACDFISGIFGGSVSSLQNFMDSADNTLTNLTYEKHNNSTTTYTEEGQLVITSSGGTNTYNGKLLKYYGTSKYTTRTEWLLKDGYLSTVKYTDGTVKSSQTDAYDITADTDSYYDIYDLYYYSDVTHMVNLNDENGKYSVEKTTEDSTVTYTVDCTYTFESSNVSSEFVYTLVYTKGDDGTYSITSAERILYTYVTMVNGTITTSVSVKVEATDQALTYTF